MAIPCYMAMTAGELSAGHGFPPYPAWMACHFSCYSTGLSNLPRNLPENAMIIINDRTPVHGHDPALIVAQLQELDELLHPKYFLMDLQRQDNPQTEPIVQAVAGAFGARVGISEQYAQTTDCPVFLGACPLRRPLEKHLAQWSGRGIWLEAAVETEFVTVNESGSQTEPAILQELGDPVFYDENLCCRYNTQLFADRAVFSICRKKEDLSALLDKAEGLGVTLAVGLYQQLGTE